LTGQKTKQIFNAWHYSSVDPVKALKQWGPEAKSIFMPYAEKIQALKDQLFNEGKPKGKQRRTVRTLTEAVIQADRGKSPPLWKNIKLACTGNRCRYS
jgi:hypothetical protein